MIEVSNLTRYYGEFPALRDVSFSAGEGQIVGLLGKNGAGKTTTLKILAGLIPPSEGTVVIDGIDIVAEPHKIRARIGFLPEDPPLYVDMTVEAFVRHIGQLNGMSSSDVDARIDEVLETTQLTERRNQVIDTLSHGYRKRVGIAQAIIHDPRLVILDEPISGLDPGQIIDMRTVIRKLATNRAVMVSSHILTEVEQVCDQLLVIDAGTLAMKGSVSDLSKPTLRVQLRGEASAAKAFFEGHSAIETASDVTAHHPTSEGVVVFDLTLHTDARETLASDLIGAGFGLRGMSDEASLERIFIDLDGGTR